MSGNCASGYAEVVKYGLIDDPAFFAWCEANGRGVAGRPPDLRQQAIVTAIQAKARIVAGDVEDRSGKRALLNLGHSFGHAIEAEAGLGTVLHGEAVALGLSLAFRFSADLGHLPVADADRVVAHLAACGLPIRLAEIAPLGGSRRRSSARMAGDKKNMRRAAWRSILARGIGRAFVEPGIDVRRLADFLEPRAASRRPSAAPGPG